VLLLLWSFTTGGRRLADSIAMVALTTGRGAAVSIAAVDSVAALMRFCVRGLRFSTTGFAHGLRSRGARRRVIVML